MYMILLQRRAIFSTIEKCLKHTLKPFTFFRTAWKHFRVAIKVLKFLWLDHLTTWPYCSHFKNSPSEVIVRNNEGQLFHSYILLNWFTQGNGTPFGSRSGQKRALCIGRVSANGGNYVFPMTRLTLNGWFKAPTQSPPPPPSEKKSWLQRQRQLWTCAKNSIIIIWRHRNGERIFQFSNFVFMNYLL